MAVKKSASKEEILNPLALRDGRVVSGLTGFEKTGVFLNHVDPQHADHNPHGATANAIAQSSASFLRVVLLERASRHTGGLTRADQLREDADTNAKPIYDKFKELADAGVKPHKLISETTKEMQKVDHDNLFYERKVRRAVERLKKKDSS